MSTRNGLVKPFIEDLKKTSGTMLEFTAGVTETEFLSNLMMQWSIIRGLEVLGEASNQLLEIFPEAQDRFPNLPFRKMYATRNRVIHGYSTLDTRTIWNIIQREIPAVHAAAVAALANWPADLT